MIKTCGSLAPAILRTIFLSAIVLAGLAACPAANAATPAISFVSGTATLGPGSAANYILVLDSAPLGLAGYNVTVSLANPGTGELLSVSYPDWASLHVNGSFPATSAWISGVDLGKNVQAGATNITLATLTVRGDSPGSSAINLVVNEMDADGGSPIAASVSASQLQVTGGGSPGSPTQGPTATPVPTVTSSPTPSATPTQGPALPTIAFGSSSGTIDQGSSITLTVRRTGNLNGPGDVTFGSASGTAVYGTDYACNPAPGTLYFAAGVSSLTIEVDALTGSAPGDGKTAVFRLSGASGATVGDPATFTLTVRNASVTSPTPANPVPGIFFGFAAAPVFLLAAMAFVLARRRAN